MPSLFVFPTLEDFNYSVALSNPDGTPYSGKGDITVYVSADASCAIITGMTAIQATETSTPGTYGVIFPAAASAEFITSQRWGDPGYVCTAEGSKVLSSDRCIFRATCPVTS